MLVFKVLLDTMLCRESWYKLEPLDGPFSPFWRFDNSPSEKVWSLDLRKERRWEVMTRRGQRETRRNCRDRLE